MLGNVTPKKKDGGHGRPPPQINSRIEFSAEKVFLSFFKMKGMPFKKDKLSIKGSGNLKLTKQGQLLLAKCIAESLELKFTKFAIGDGLLDEDEKIFELTELKHHCMDLPLTNLKVVGNGTAQITAILI